MFASTSPNFRVTVHVIDNRTIVRLSGRASSFEVDELQRELNRVLVVRPTHVVFDLTELETISSLAIGTMVTFRRALSRFGGSACLVGATLVVAEALHRTAVDRLFAEEF